MQVTIRQGKKDATRKKIIDAAFKIYSENGFSTATSLIAKEAGVAHGSIFLHFPTREDLIACLIEDFADTLAARFRELEGVYGAVEELLGAHIDILSEYENFYSRFVMGASGLPENAKSSFEKIKSSFAVHFNDALNSGIGNGELKRLPPQILLNAWIGLLHYYLLNGDVSISDGSILKKYKKQLIFTYCELLRRQ